MTLQWTAVALFLYGEIALNLLLCVPFVSAKRCGNKRAAFRGQELKVLVEAQFQRFFFLFYLSTVKMFRLFILINLG